MPNEALLVIDVQNVYFKGSLPVTYPPGSLQRILEAMDHAALSNIPILVIQHHASRMAAFEKGSDSWELHPEVSSRAYQARIEKTMPGSFSGTCLEEELKKRGIQTVVIAGYMTQMCCDTTARQAFERGYKVIFLSDATGTLTVENRAGKISDRALHEAVLITQAMRFSEVMTAAEWAARHKKKR